MNLKEHMKICGGSVKSKSYKTKLRQNKIISILTQFIKNNIKEYFIITIILLIGIFLGVMFINNSTHEQKMEISSYINTYMEAFEQTNSDSNLDLLQNNLRDNIILAIIMWFVGSTVVGIPIVFGIIAFRGFCLGYTISAITMVLGISKGIGFTAVSIIMQNILFIPAIVLLGVSSLKTYKSILNDKRRENIKLELIRHTVFCGLIALLLLVSAIVETEISTNLLRAVIKYF
jgi:stage II sporulation protein M